MTLLECLFGYNLHIDGYYGNLFIMTTLLELLLDWMHANRNTWCLHGGNPNHGRDAEVQCLDMREDARHGAGWRRGREILGLASPLEEKQCV